MNNGAGQIVDKCEDIINEEEWEGVKLWPWT